MLIIYVGRGRRSPIEELAKSAECLEADAWLEGEGDGRTGGVIKHPGRDLEGAVTIEVEATIEDGLAAPHYLSQDVDILPEPGMEWVPDRADIDQSGLVMRSSTTSSAGTPRWGTSPQRSTNGRNNR